MNLSVEHINYTISGKKILHDISFKINDGDILAILGHNGAGKTSLFEILTGIIRPNTGNVFYNERSFSSIKGKTGVLWDDISIFPWLKVKEVIHYVSTIHKIKSYSMSYYNYLDLKRIENTFMHKLSKGERKKVELFLSVIHNPELLILDEPTSSLDPLTRNLVWENIILQKNKTILFSTHQWEEAFRYASKIVFLHEGKIINEPCSGEELIHSTQFVQKIAIHNSIRVENMNVFSYETKSNIYYLIESDDDSSLDKIKRQTMNYSILPIDLEDIYYYLTRNTQ
jgi:ABC-2 type transport system ATP-binding protein